MEPLLSITTVPISIEVNITNAKLEQETQLPKVKISRERGGFSVEAEPIQVKIDTFDIQQETGRASMPTLRKEWAENGMKLAYQGTVKTVQEGNELAKIYEDIRPSDIAHNKAQESFKVETVMDFIPKSRPDISWDGGTLSLNYQTDELNFDWDIADSAKFEFIPAAVEFIVKEYPRVEIEYLGGPIYVPPSADPSFTGEKFDIKG